jgi:hypothetical protein
MIDFAEFAKQLAVAASRVRPDLERDLLAIGELQKTMAAEYIGREMPFWQPLAESTIRDKARKGFEVPAPLLRTGDMRESLAVQVEPTPLGVEMAVGSDNPIALYQEMGTPTIPPRPFLAPSLVASLEYAQDKLSETAVALLTPGVRK